MDRLKFADLFAGCGGLSFGFHKDKRFTNTVATDIWSQAKETYELNFKKSTYLLADLSNNNELNEVSKAIGKDLDLLIGGPPCKGFSTLNNSKKVSIYNTLVDQYLNVVERTLPKVFVIENVRGFVSKKHPSGITYPEHVKNRLSKINSGYNYAEVLLNTLDYGLGQSRIRYFFIGTKKSYDKNSALLNGIVSGLESAKTKKTKVLKDLIGDLPKVQVRGGADVLRLKNGTVVYNHKSMNHSISLENRFKHIPPGGGLLNVPVNLLTGHLKKMITGEYGSGGFAKNIYGRMEWDKPSGTIVAGMDKITCGRFVHPEENRLLTPRECARIQSFPDDFIFTGGQVSQYYQIGNAVPPEISKIMAKIVGDLLIPTKKTKKRSHAINSVL